MSLLDKLRISSRLLIATLLPVLLTAGVIAWITANQLRAAGEAEVQRLEENLLEARKTGLQDLVTGVRTLLEPEINSRDLSQEEAQSLARAKIRSIGFGDNNYIYAYTEDAFRLAFRPNPKAEGYSDKSTDASKAILAGLFRTARSGDGFQHYTWLNPATGEEEPKLSYSVVVEKWDWVIGAGVYVTEIKEAVAAARAEIDAQVSMAMTLIVGITLAIVVVAAGLGMAVGRTVTRPMKRVSELMQEIADGDGNLTHRLPADGADELSELGRRFNAFVDKIQTTIREVGVTTDQVASAAEELSRVANETRTAVQEQGSETDQIASAINEMAATIQQISGNANEVESAASDADRLAQEGGKIIGNAQQSVDRLSAEIKRSAASIISLSDKTGDIQQVLAVIHAVTDQTNLLALNAAIEAARAGEHGRGFSVVADEVRQLARRSSESADQIRVMIEGFVTESSTAVERMHASEGHSEETVERIVHATGSLRTIETSVGQIHDQVTQIATAAEQQSQVAEEINKNVVRIVAAAQRSDSGVTQTHEASHELARLGETLRSLIGQFKV